MQLIFLDTETTGIEETDRLCQVCYRVGDEVKMEYFKPPLPVSVKSMSITHITNKMLENKEAFVGSTFETELQKLLSTGILVAHNCQFDAKMLSKEGVEIPQSICTLRVARHLDAGGVIPEYNLQYLRYYLDLDVPGNAHDAEGDVNVLYAVFKRQLSKIQEQTGSEESAIQKMIEISSTPSLYKKFNFGKHKDKEISEVLQTDRGYLEWLLKQKLESGDEDVDWIYTLKHYLGLL
ncbi:MAG: exonuclease domain-containing protein [Candidatus Zambryskibacteria bacterium]|nr:exonuclease domain-containing protein [Candidatus Zambryskibacteria bacterium]